MDGSFNIGDISVIKASDIMSRQVITVDGQCTVMTAAKKMSLLNVGAVVITDNGRKPIGVFTERDLLNRVVAKDRDPAITPICEVMTKSLKTLGSDTPILKAFRLSHKEGIRHIIIVDEDVLAGIISIRDINSAMVNILEKIIFD